jgi:hypothetical protein
MPPSTGSGSPAGPTLRAGAYGTGAIALGGLAVVPARAATAATTTAIGSYYFNHLSGASAAADGSDATALTIRVTDAYGNHRPGTAGDVALTLSGPATLIAANPFPLAALGGVGGGFIRSWPGTTGRVSLTATHATLGEASVGLTVT